MTLKFVKSIIFVFSTVALFTACSSDRVQEYNKPALYWYNKMINNISSGDLDEADDTYTSLESEHRNSPLISSSMMIMANAHIDEEEYALANYYLDEYIKRFGLSKNIDYVRFLKIKAKFLAFEKENRDQKLILETITDIEDFIKRFPDSPYIHLAKTISARLYMAKTSLNGEIVSLYERIDKPEAAKIYEERLKDTWVDQKEIEPVHVPWYQAIFE